MVMTPQILLNALSHSFLSLDDIKLLIFDECHHAKKKHAMALIMKVCYMFYTLLFSLFFLLLILSLLILLNALENLKKSIFVGVLSQAFM